MIKEIPFKSFDEVKPFLSGFDSSFSLENVKSSLLTAASKVAEVISEAVYNRALTFYKTVPPPEPDPEADPDVVALDTDLLYLVQFVIANYGMFEHWPFLVARISNGSVTTINNDNERTVSLSLSNELKEKLEQNAWIKINELINFLNDNAETFTEWASSEQFTAVKSLLITFEEFNQIYDIGNSPAFFYKLRNIIKQLTYEEIQPRIENLEDFQTDLESESPSDLTIKLFLKIKKYLVYKSLFYACRRWDYEEFPRPIRRYLHTDILMTNKSKDKEAEYVRTVLAADLNNEATKASDEMDVVMKMIANIKAAENNLPEVNDLSKSSKASYRTTDKFFMLR